MGMIASQITSLTIVYSIVYSDADKRKHQSSASLAFVRGIHRWPVNSPHKWPVTRKMFPFWWRHHVYAVSWSVWVHEMSIWRSALFGKESILCHITSNDHFLHTLTNTFNIYSLFNNPVKHHTWSLLSLSNLVAPICQFGANGMLKLMFWTIL